MTIYKEKLIETHINLKKDIDIENVKIEDIESVIIRVSNFKIDNRGVIHESIFNYNGIKGQSIWNDLDENISEYVEGFYIDFQKRYLNYVDKLFANKNDIDYYLSKFDNVQEHSDIIDL